VYVASILTDIGKTIVQKHESTYDAQSLYCDLVERYSKSTMAMINKQDIFLEIVLMNVKRWLASQESSGSLGRIACRSSTVVMTSTMSRNSLYCRSLYVTQPPSAVWCVKHGTDILSTQLRKCSALTNSTTFWRARLNSLTQPPLVTQEAPRRSIHRPSDMTSTTPMPTPTDMTTYLGTQ
jgi:hypothetical protein